MNFNLKTEPKKRIPPKQDLAIEEYKILVDEARFAMIRYMQMLAIYIAFIGLLVREIIETQEPPIVIIWFVGLSLLNGVAYFGSWWFRSMAYHTLNRMVILANHLGIQKPHPMIWGYWGGVASFILSEILAFSYIIWFFFYKY